MYLKLSSFIPYYHFVVHCLKATLNINLCFATLLRSLTFTVRMIYVQSLILEVHFKNHGLREENLCVHLKSQFETL